MRVSHEDLAQIIPSLRNAGLKRLLHVGCGTAGKSRLPECYQTGDWEEVRVDIDPAVNPDIIADLIDLGAIPNGSVDSVWSSHNLEHLDGFNVPQALREFRRVLKPGGFVLITLPDLQAIAKLIADGKADDIAYISPAGPITAMDMLFGHQASQKRGNHFMAHRTGFTATQLGRLLIESGFSSVRVTRGTNIDLWAIACN